MTVVLDIQNKLCEFSVSLKLKLHHAGDMHGSACGLSSHSETVYVYYLCGIFPARAYIGGRGGSGNPFSVTAKIT